MPPDALAGALALLAAVAVSVLAALAVDVRLPPEVVEPSIVLTFSGLGGLAFSAYGALRAHPPERVARLALAGNLAGGALGALMFAGLLLAEVVS